MSHKQNLDMGWRRDGKGERGGGRRKQQRSDWTGNTYHIPKTQALTTQLLPVVFGPVQTISEQLCHLKQPQGIGPGKGEMRTYVHSLNTVP